MKNIFLTKKACHYSERPGDNNGTTACEDGFEANVQCERYADNGCYEAGNWHLEDDVRLGEHFRGCSSFIQE